MRSSALVASQALALRCRIVLGVAEGGTNREVAEQLGVNRVTVGEWRQRFAAQRLEGLVDAPRPGAVRTIADEVVEAVVVETLESAPADATHWSTRSLAQQHGISRQTVSEIRRAFGLKPWRQDHFKVSPDPELIEKVRDLVGLYLSPPVAAAVYAVDEKPQIQALNRSAPILPMLPTTAQRASHDYVPPQRHHQQVLRMGQAEWFEKGPIERHDVAGRHGQAEADLLLQGEPVVRSHLDSHGYLPPPVDIDTVDPSRATTGSREASSYTTYSPVNYPGIVPCVGAADRGSSRPRWNNAFAGGRRTRRRPLTHPGARQRSDHARGSCPVVAGRPDPTGRGASGLVLVWSGTWLGGRRGLLMLGAPQQPDPEAFNGDRRYP